jgi:PhnB protein
MAKLSVYIFSEDARKQAEFYAKALNGEILDIKTFADAPGSNEEDKDRVMHLVLKVGEHTIYMADNGVEPVERGNGMDLTLEFATEEEARAVFERLSEGGKVFMPFQRMFWGTRFGRLEDPFGVRWQISTQS